MFLFTEWAWIMYILSCHHSDWCCWTANDRPMRQSKLPKHYFVCGRVCELKAGALRGVTTAIYCRESSEYKSEVFGWRDFPIRGIHFVHYICVYREQGVCGRVCVCLGDSVVCSMSHYIITRALQLLTWKQTMHTHKQYSIHTQAGKHIDFNMSVLYHFIKIQWDS